MCHDVSNELANTKLDQLLVQHVSSHAITAAVVIVKVVLQVADFAAAVTAAKLPTNFVWH